MHSLNTISTYIHLKYLKYASKLSYLLTYFQTSIYFLKKSWSKFWCKKALNVQHFHVALMNKWVHTRSRHLDEALIKFRYTNALVMCKTTKRLKNIFSLKTNISQEMKRTEAAMWSRNIHTPFIYANSLCRHLHIRKISTENSAVPLMI